MEFCDKLNILMKITQSTNKGLAAEISVDPSLISLLRSGRRGLPRNRGHIRNMANCFASRCTADYQRQALAEMTGISSLKAEMPVSVLAIQLERWLTGEMDMVDKIVEGLQLDGHIDHHGGEILLKPIPKEETAFYCGDEGRQNAVRHFFSLIKEGPVGICDNSDISWATGDYQFSLDVVKTIKEHLKRGNSFTQILPPMNRTDSYSESLKFMLPIYASGLAKVYYYPRLQNSPALISLAVAPGRCVMCTHGLQGSSSPQVTMVSANKQLTDAYTEQFKDFLAMCRPALDVHKDPAEFSGIISEMIAMEGAIYQKVAPISTSTMPTELIDICAEKTQDPTWKEAFHKLRGSVGAFEARLKNSVFLDICRLSSPEKIRSGTVPIGCPYMPYEGHPCYTPETYAMHLKNILCLMDEYKNYTFLPISGERWPGYNLFVNDGGLALLARGEAPPAMIIELRRPEMVAACQEHLMRIAEQDGFSGISRDRIRIQINSLIRELER